MKQDEFLKMLAEENFPEPTLVVREPSGFLDSHSHPFEVKALVVDGQIDLMIDDLKRVYLPGDVFHLDFEQMHAERYGNQGVSYLASRKSRG
jgi:quercetin dioxygenase-like cupin family protein